MTKKESVEYLEAGVCDTLFETSCWHALFLFLNTSYKTSIC